MAAKNIIASTDAVEIMDISDYKPRRISSAKWRDLINPSTPEGYAVTFGKVRVELLHVRRSLGEGGCPKCQNEMRIVALINERDVIERILRHLGLWEAGIILFPARAPPVNTTERIIEPWQEDILPDGDYMDLPVIYANA